MDWNHSFFFYIRHNKFLMRLANKHTDNVAIGILNGNNCLLAGTYKYSLGEYMNVYKIERNNPIVPLMLGITFVHLACQKFSSRKHSLGAKYLISFFSSLSLKTREKIISFPQLVLLSLYIFWGKCLYFSIFEWYM